MHNNTRRLIDIEKSAMKEYGVCGCGFCEAVAETAGETGNEYPSESAIQIASEAAASKDGLAKVMAKRCTRCWNKCAKGMALQGIVGVVVS